ncbi:MAG: peptide chain release factor 1 [Lachnospirales bacterium]
MFDKLEDIVKRFYELENLVNDPETIKDQNKWRQLMKEHADLKDLVDTYLEYKGYKNALQEAKELLEESNDEDLRSLAKEEVKENTTLIEEFEDKLKVLLLPKDPNDEKNVIVEIRGGAGGDEAALFASDLFRMYTRYAERRKWKTELIDMSDSEAGGIKEVSFLIKGQGAYSRLKYDSGVHRVQRVPATESSGRIHTSTVTVAVLPEVEDVEVEINENDVRVDVFRSSGNGGQSVNTTDSAVRLTHMPSGIVISCQDEKSQLKNKEKAFKVLRAKLYDLELEKQNKELADDRRSQVGTGDRSERIRTYNFPQGRVSDHRVQLTLHKIDAILDGDLDEILDTLITSDQAEKLKSIGE